MKMNLKEEMYKTIIANCYTEEDKHEDSVIMGEDFDKLANDLAELVKKMGYIQCCKSDSEQLFCQCKKPAQWTTDEGFTGCVKCNKEIKAK